MKNRLLAFALCAMLSALCHSGCAYFWDALMSSPGPQVVHEHTQTRQVGAGKATSTNWWTGDGKSHWCYCWESKGQTVCSGDCR